MKFSSISNIGRHRDTNEDSYSNISIDDYDFFIVADGMGGHSDGELASSLASKSYIDFIRKANLDDYEKISDLQDAAIDYANEKVFDLAREKEEKMGTTVVCLCLDHKENKYYISHIGDSRLYLYRDGQLTQITKDHSLVNELIESGALKEEEADNFINKNAITRAVGIGPDVRADNKSIDVKEDDIILIVTDGLFNEVNSEIIVNIIEENKDVYDISSRLIDAANASGGHDNITVTTIKM
ncbi:Stp1/IreP family PP2C-type Ser/Thr phosphatase [uncultured Anaerococcus sp.]|uniref:Stp1/IreP family PP2C-type Ser/Thr phosphatase n=1 Tax=uncultured Anaerococcus sp. TaxID=293428 RepID=UPI002630325A|nr:Stp1/IreP family PP2C-type Ser/Thr phosphatase [uncultured Anaerococcus sp.]